MPSYLNTEPELGDGESILQKYPAEVYLVERKGADGGDSTFRFHAPARDPVTFDSEERARLFADLYTVVDGFRIEGIGERGIPVNVATADTAAVAAYMYAKWGSTPTHISQTIGSDRESVLEFLERISTRAERMIGEWNDAEMPPGEVG